MHKKLASCADKIIQNVLNIFKQNIELKNIIFSFDLRHENGALQEIIAVFGQEIRTGNIPDKKLVKLNIFILYIFL